MKTLLGIVKARARSRAIVEGGGYLFVLLIVAAAVIVMKAGTEHTFGGYTEFMALISMLIWTPLRSLSKAYNDFQNSLPGVYSVLNIVDNPEATPDTDQPKDFPSDIKDISIEDVSFRYHEGPLVLKDISVKITQNQVVAFVGHTGSGKSTMVTLLPRFRDPSQGKLCINGIDIRDFSIKDLRRNMALVNQDPYLFNTSVRDNLLQGKPSASDEELWQALEKVQLMAFIKEKPEGLEFQVGERGNNLSGGQRQRLAIARAILKDAPILILDEATSSQDNVTEKKIQNALAVLMKDRTTFVIAHRLSTIHQADHILVFKDGSVVEEGKHEDLKDGDSEYSKLYHSQFET